MPRLMLLEDDDTMVHLLTTLLHMEGYQVSVLSNPDLDTISATVRAQAPDLLLMDVNLRKASGLDLVRRLRREPDLAQVKILMTSGMDLRAQCLKAGADGFILKPFMPEELMRQIHGMNGHSPGV